MQPDLEFLRRHYASLSDEALLEIHRAELVETARPLYDQELVQRKLASKYSLTRARVESPPEGSQPYHPPDGDERPEWIEDSAEVFGRQSHPGDSFAPEVDSARAVLEAAGIPCFVEYVETPVEPEDFDPPKPIREWKLMVPGQYNIEATSIIERDMLNEQFESDWKTHLEMLSDEELREVSPQKAFCGLFDKVERVTRVYDEELERRRMKANAT
jgi:hypothetical protein